MNEKRQTTYARNPEQLARAFGLNLSPRKRKKSIATVNDWLAHKSFPAKTAKGWILSDVRKWHEDHTQNSKPQTQDPKSDTPDLFSKEQVQTVRLKNLIARHGEGKRLNDEERAELRQAGYDFWEQDNPTATSPAPVTPNGVPGTRHPSPFIPQIADSDLCDTFADIARRLDLHYRTPEGAPRLQFEINPQAVSDWKNGKRLPKGAPPPPGRINSRQWSLAQWIAWFDKWLWAEWKVSNQPQGEMLGDADLRRMQRDEEFRKLEDSQFERDIRRGKYIEVDAVERIGGAWARKYHDLWKDQNETVEPDAFEQFALMRGVDPAAVAQLKQFLVEQRRDRLDALERSCAAMAEEFNRLVEAEKNEQQQAAGT